VGGDLICGILFRVEAYSGGGGDLLKMIGECLFKGECQRVVVVAAAVVVVAAVAGQPTPPSVKDGGALPEHTEYDRLRICPFLVVESGSSPPHADTEE